jgi:integrase
MSRSTIHTIHSILSGAFEAAQRWEWVDHNPAESAKPPTVRQKKTAAIPPSAVVNVIQQARSSGQNAIALYVWLVAITGVRRGELCAVQVRDIDLGKAVLHVAFNYVVKGGKKVRKDTKTHQDRYLAIDPITFFKGAPSARQRRASARAGSRTRDWIPGMREARRG